MSSDGNERGADRRQYPRYERRLTFEHTEREEFPVLETLNVSAGGALCRVDRYLEPMTRLRVRTQIPDDSRIEADAVVVRVDPEEPVEGRDDYQVALFFQKMDADHRRALSRYLES